MKNKKILALSTFSALLLVATIIGCTGTGGILFPGGGSLFEFFTPKFAYLFNGDGENTITTYTVNSSTGALTIASNEAATNVSGCCQVFMDVDPNSKFLFVPNYTADTVSVFTVNNDGTLTGPVGTDVAAGTTPFSARLHPSGKFLYVANYGSDDISVYSVGTGGALTPVGSPVAAGHLPHTLIMDWQGRFLYVTHGSYYNDDSVANDTINAYSINGQTGALTAVGSFNTGGVTPRGGMVDYSGQYLIVANRGNDNCGGCLPAADRGSVSVLSIGSTGGLTPVAGSPFRDPGGVNGGPFNIAEAIVGGTAYIAGSNLDDANVSVFALDTATGKLTPVSGSPFDLSLDWPHYVAVDTSGKFGYIVDTSDDRILVVNLSSTGTPSQTGTDVTDGVSFWSTQLIFSH